MRVSRSFAVCGVLTVALLATLSAEERVVRVPPGPAAAMPWPRCGSLADEKITPNVASQISPDDPDGKWSFDDADFGLRSPREDVANCVEAFVPTTDGCSGIRVSQRLRHDGPWIGVAHACVAGISDPDCSPAPTQPQAAGFLMHRALGPKGTPGCWIQLRNWRADPGATSATDFKLEW
jgi:hypothetical protein